MRISSLFRRIRYAHANVRGRLLVAFVCIALTTICTALLSSVARAQEAAISVTFEPIPLSGYKSWSLFLICNDDWVRPQGAARLKALYEQFLAFGDAIGRDHVAVWLAASRRSPTRIDSARSRRFCTNLGLPQTEGPYLVLADRYPGAAITERPDTFASDLGNHLVLSLNGISASETTRVLSAIANQLVLSSPQSRDIHSEEFWRRLQNAFRTSKDPLLRKVSVTFKTNYFSTAIAHPDSTLLTTGNDEPSAVIASGSTWSSRKGDRTPMRLTAFAKHDTGLRFEADQNAYVGRFYVTLQNLDEQHDGGELIPPVTIAVGGPGGIFEPTPVPVSRLLKWTGVEVRVRAPSDRKYLVSVSADLNDPGNSLALDVIQPRIVLNAVSTRILGWGLGTTQIMVSSRDHANGVVHLTAEGGGSLATGSVQLDASGSGVTSLRSDVSPNATIRGDPSQGESNLLTITFRSPLLFLAAAILGGLLGAFLRGKGRKKWPMALAIGMATAILLTVGHAVGFNAPIERALGPNSLATSGEAVVFFVGAIAALLGVSVLIPGPSRKS